MPKVPPISYFDIFTSNCRKATEKCDYELRLALYDLRAFLAFFTIHKKRPSPPPLVETMRKTSRTRHWRTSAQTSTINNHDPAIRLLESVSWRIVRFYLSRNIWLRRSLQFNRHMIVSEQSMLLLRTYKVALCCNYGLGQWNFKSRETET